MENHLHLSKLSLINFKNYKQAEISFSPDINCLIGPNGAGKTNILDAFYYLSTCKPYLNPVDTQNISFEESFFVLQSTWKENDMANQVYCGVKKGQKKVFKQNKVTYEKLANHIGQYPVVMISPYDRNLIMEGSEIRRKWLDGIISQFDRDYLKCLMKYKKIVKQRNALLRNMAENSLFDPESKNIWDEQLIENGKKIHLQRKEIIADFVPVFQKYYQWLTDDKEEVGLDYRSQLFDSSFQELLKRTEEIDQLKRYTTIGTHKDDFIFTIKQKPIKKFGSQGQQKSFLIALRLAQYEWLLTRLNKKPVLLLDDIFDKLDNNRVERLMQMVNEQIFGQVLITDTDKERVASIFSRNNIPYRSFEVDNNRVKEVAQKTAMA